MLYSYDAGGTLFSVDYNGTGYYYLRNAQNDIVRLIDNSGNTVVEYACDSCGKFLSTSGSLASILGKNNPFCYCGYIYNEETWLYYLCSAAMIAIGQAIRVNSCVDLMKPGRLV